MNLLLIKNKVFYFTLNLKKRKMLKMIFCHYSLYKCSFYIIKTHFAVYLFVLNIFMSIQYVELKVVYKI